jgi:hypothetical protein
MPKLLTHLTQEEKRIHQKKTRTEASRTYYQRNKAKHNKRSSIYKLNKIWGKDFITTLLIYCDGYENTLTEIKIAKLRNDIQELKNRIGFKN